MTFGPPLPLWSVASSSESLHDAQDEVATTWWPLPLTLAQDAPLDKPRLWR